MSEEDNTNAEEKKKSPILALFFLVVVIAGIIFALNTIKNNEKTSTADTNETVVESSEQTTEETNEVVEITKINPTADFNLDDAATPRILGNPNAPIKISEHSSFTCPACANFHKNNWPLIKRDYIDTGKAYLVFDDFPRNKFDLEVGAVARCLPDATYFQFVNLLFETQKSWVNENYMEHVKQNAKITGVTDEQLANCIGNEELYKALAARQQAAMNDDGVTATPTLIINDTVKISGTSPYAKIKDAIDQALADMPVDPETGEPMQSE